MERRTLVVGLAALGGSTALPLAGCGPRSGSDAGARAGGGDTGPSADERLVADALAQEEAALAVVELTRRRHPGLRPTTAPALAAHQQHVRVLRGTTDRPDGAGRRPSRPSVPGRPAQALAELARAEARLSREHAGLALEARSGALARVLASMAASSAQLGATLGSGPGGGA